MTSMNSTMPENDNPNYRSIGSSSTAHTRPWAEPVKLPDIESSNIRVYNESMRQQLLLAAGSAPDAPTERKTKSASARSRTSGSDSQASHVRKMRPSLADKRALKSDGDKQVMQKVLKEKRDELMERIQIEGSLRQQERAVKMDEQFHRMYDELMREEDVFVKDVGTFLELKAKNDIRKKEQLWREWDDKVYKKIQAEIDGQLDQADSNDIGHQRRVLFDQYLNVCNKKEGVFRDIIIEAEYDPMVAHDKSIRYNSQRKNDPVKLEINKFIEENGTLGSAFKSKERYPGRATLKATMWDKLEATPYGRFSKMMDGGGAGNNDALDNMHLWASSVPMDDYNVAYGDEWVAKEFPKGKRCFGGWEPGKGTNITVTAPEG